MLEISVVICTHNRPILLKQALQSLVDQTLGKEYYEVIIVDNASTDHTKDVAREFLDYENFSYLYEPNQGLSYSRNTGYQNAQADYVAYIDDDAKADKNWLKEMLRVIKDINPDILGGPIYPFYETKKPKWFKDEYEIRCVSQTPRYLKDNEYISGSNFIIKKDLLKKL